MKTNLKRLVCCLVATLCFALGLALVSVPAYAEEIDYPTDEELAVYEADGTLEERIAYQESLSVPPSNELLELMEADGTKTQFDTQGTMPRTGSARIFGVCVSFPEDDDGEAMTLDEEDGAEALDAIIDGESQEYPYESLAAFYYRASYGQLTMSGDAFDYIAEHSRSYYTNDTQLLFKEILVAFDGQIDFGDYDGNGDGIIDCIVVRFAGENTGWGSSWWSNESLLDLRDDDDNVLHFDGKVAGSRVLLHLPSETPEGVHTFIHEVGHALGLPDFYQAADSGRPRSGGCLTSDPMDDKIGDHNGFSKWVLGWLDDSQVTWVTVTENGVEATRGGVSVGTPTDDGGLRLDLAPFTSDDVSETGGIIVVADHSFDKYSSYYVLQYDNYAGNQSMFWGIDEWNPLSSGFRMYRIQASVDEDGYLIDTNFFGVLHDQLIELVDPDAGLPHYSDLENNITLTTTDGERWGCMFYEGDSISPTTSPSTNFFENSVGWTGIAIDFVRSDADGGSVVVRYDGSEKPSGETPTLTCAEGSELINGGTLTLLADSGIALADDAEPYLRLDGEGTYTFASVETSGSTILLKANIDTDVLAKASSAEVVFEEGSFLLYGGATSAEVVVPVPIGGIELSASGFLDGGSYLPPFVSLAGAYESEDGASYFYQCDNDLPFRGGLTYYKNIIDANDPTKVTKVLVEGDEVAVAKQTFVDNSPVSATNPVDRVGYLVPEGVDTGEYTWLLDATEANDRIYALFRKDGDDVAEKCLFVFEKDGTLVGSATVPSSAVSYGLVRVSPTGVVAVTIYYPFYNEDVQQFTYFYDTDLSYIDVLAIDGTGCGYWTEDGRFVAYGWRRISEFAPGATIEDPKCMLCYDITVPLGEVPVEPDEPDTPDTPDEPVNYDVPGKWVKSNGSWYYVDSEGKYLTDQWLHNNGAWYYLDESGRALTNKWLSYDGTWYYFGADCSCQWSTWVKTGGYWYYLGADGKLVENDWVKYKGSWYYLGEEGRMLATKWLRYDGAWYYFGSDGACRWSTWVKTGGYWYYLGSDCRLVESDWVKYKGSWYYLGEEGRMLATKWLRYDGAWYYFASDGKAQWSTWVKTGGYWYYLGSKGKLVENGWIRYNGNWYYADENGAAVWNTWAPYNGREYYINSKGIATGASRAIA